MVLRSYQKKMINAYVQNRFNITMTSRQMGKCTFGSHVTTDDPGHKDMTLEQLYYENKKDMSLLDRFKFALIKIYNWLDDKNA